MSTYNIPDESGNNRDGTLYGGKIQDGGETRGYKNVARLDNDVGEDETNVNDYIEVGGEPISTNAATIGCWVRPEGESSSTAGIVLNNTSDDNLCGIVLRPNDMALSLGYVWGTSTENYDYDFGITIEKDEWSHVVVIIYPSGLARLFVNNIYVASHDTGYVREIKTFDNLEIGRFSGMVDNVVFYSDTLDYGNVEIDQPAKYDVSYLYKEDRASFETTPEETAVTKATTVEEFKKLTQGIRFYYMQDDDYVAAHDKYLEYTVKRMNAHTIFEKDAISMQTTEQINEQKTEIIGGVDSGVRAFARARFRTIPGEIVPK